MVNITPNNNIVNTIDYDNETGVEITEEEG